jgi:hypothetical protein
MAVKTISKTECLNPNTGGRMKIDSGIHELMSQAIRHALTPNKSLTYTQMVEGIHDFLKKKKISFEGSVEWYAVTVKNDMVSRGLIKINLEKGKKLHRLSK